MVDKRHEERVCQFGCCRYWTARTTWVTEEQMRVAFPYLRWFEGVVRGFDV